MKITKKIISEVIEKCYTLNQIRTKLSGLTRNERVQLLEEQNKMTHLDWMEYDRLRNKNRNEYTELRLSREDAIEEYREDYYEEYGEYPKRIPPHVTNNYDKEIKKIEDEWDELVFPFERRIFEDYSISKGDNPIPSFNWDDYMHDMDGFEKYAVNDEDGYVDMLDVKLGASRDSIGDIENNLITVQSDNINYTPMELKWLRQYFNDGRLSSFLTSKINGRKLPYLQGAEAVYDEDYGEEYFVEINMSDKWNKEFNNIKTHLDNAIGKSRGLVNPTILYHAGRPDPSLLPGDKGVWKGYKSMSFQEQVMGKHSNINDGYWSIIVLASAGTKGVCANDLRFRGYSFVDEHEYLLGRNTEYTVVSMDYDTHTQVVMLD